MAEWLWFPFDRMLLGLVVLPLGAALGWFLYDAFIRPRLIPRREIETLAEAAMRTHPEDAEEWAFREEQGAWHRSHGDERARWHRVRKEIRRRSSA